jgi:hypothetical protein
MSSIRKFAVGGISTGGLRSGGLRSGSPRSGSPRSGSLRGWAMATGRLAAGYAIYASWCWGWSIARSSIDSTDLTTQAIAATGLFLAGVVAILILNAGIAHAAGTYQPLCESGAAVCSGIGGYHNPFGVAVDNSSGEKSGDVYVASVSFEGQSTVARFTAFGAPDGFSGTNPNITGADKNFLALPGAIGAVGVAVDSAGNFYVTTREAEPNAVAKFSPSGEPIPSGSFALPSGFSAAVGIAVDNSGGPSNGDIWVGNESTHVIGKFSPTGEKKLEIPNAGNPYSLAVDAHGNVYDGNHGENVQKFSEAGVPAGVLFDSHSSQSVAFDPSTDEIFVVNEGGAQIQPYTEAGVALTPFSTIGSSGFNAGVAVGGGPHHFVYVSDFNNNNAEMYGIGEAPKEAPTTGAAEVNGTSVKLHGTLNPGGTAEELEYQFDYNTGGTCTGGGSAPVLGDYIANAKETAVQVEAKNLAPKTEYTYCLVSLNPFASLPGSSLVFTTEAGAPTVAEESANPAAISAIVSAKINPGGAATTCEVEYGLSSVSENKVPCPALAEPEAITPQPVSVELTPLAAATKYHYRFTATSSVETVHGTEEEFETKPLVEVKTSPATGETSNSATLNGEIKTGSEGGSYQFEYGIGSIGTGSITEHTTPIQLVEEETNGFKPVAEPVTGLEPNQTYHFRILGFPKGSVTAIEGAELEFSTKAAKPAVISSSVSGIPTRTTASLSGEINPENSKTEYDIEYGKTEAKGAPGSPTSLMSLASPTGPQKIATQTLEELEAGTTYHYRIVASNAAGVTLGPEETFTTAPAQIPIVEAESSEQVTQTTATVTAKVNPNGLQTTYILEVGTEVEGKVAYTPTFGEVGSSSEGVSLTFALTNLLPGTTYHYRIVAVNEDGTVEGADITFATPSFISPIVEPPHPLLIPVPPVPPPEGKKKETKLEKALKACTTKPKKKRAACDRQAEKKYGPKVHKKTKAKHKKK